MSFKQTQCQIGITRSVFTMRAMTKKTNPQKHLNEQPQNHHTTIPEAR